MSDTALWLKPEKFLDPEFSPEQYVSDLQRMVPLESIQTELGKHLEKLQTTLVEVVNDDYMTFVNLSTNLVDVDSAVNRMNQPLLQVKSQIEETRSSIALKASELQDGLERQKAAAENRALLQLAQDAAHVLAKVEKLMDDLKPATPSNEEDIDALEAHCRLLDRMCSEVGRLNFYLAKGKGMPLLTSIQPRATAASNQLVIALDAALRSTLRSQHPAALGILLHSYNALAQPQLAEVVVREEMIAPLLHTLVSSTGDANGTEQQQQVATLGQFLQQASDKLKQEAGPFFEFVMSPAAGAQAFDFLGGSVLPEVLACAEKTLPGIFSPGLPDAFCANYKETIKFFQILETFCVNEDQLQQLRSSAAYEKFIGKYNLAAYFSLRFRDIAGSIEEQLGTCGFAPNNNKEAEYKYAATAALWHALQQTKAESNFLAPISDKFLRLALQLVARFSTWVEQGLDAAARDGGSNSEQREASPEDQEGDAASSSWATGATVEQLALLWTDIKKLATALTTQYTHEFLAVAGLTAANNQAAATAVAAAFTDSSQQLASAAQHVIHAASHALAEKCCVALRQLRGIVATFRMANRAAPTRPSHYVVNILQPLQQFLSSPEGGANFSVERKNALTSAVAESICQQYQQLATDTLITVRKTEDSLRRLKSRKTDGAADGAAPAAGAMDIDKMIALQLFLDVQEFGRQLKRFELDAAALPAFERLWKAVAPEEQVDTIQL